MFDTLLFSRRILLTTLSICSVLLLASPAASAVTMQEACEQRLPKMDVTLVFPKLTYQVNPSLSYKHFPDKRQHGNSSLESIGLTVINYTSSYAFDANRIEDRRNGYECITAKVNVRVHVPPLQVYVGREFPPGTCAYNEILAHELRHVSTYQRHFASIEPVLRRALEQRFKQRQPQYARMGLSTKLLDYELKTSWLPYINTLISHGNQYHQAVDTQAETDRISMACNGEIQRGMRLANTRGG